MGALPEDLHDAVAAQKQSGLEELAIALEATGDYRVLRRLVPRDRFNPDDGLAEKKIGILADTETTGLDYTKDEVIELAMIKFEFAADGRIFRVLDTFESFREPSVPIPAEITQLTGITSEMVAGKTIDPAAVDAFVSDAVVTIAHNAGFDRKFMENAWSCFEHMTWACSVSEVDWRAEGFDGSRLGYLLAGSGLFHDAHRGLGDCRALLEILARPLPVSGELALKRLLDTARRTTFRIWAHNAPFDLKDQLKARRYHWNDGSDARPKAWWIDIDEEMREAEVTFLHKEIYGREVELLIKKLTAWDRFSVRA